MASNSTSETFERKIVCFSQLRLAPLLSPSDLENLTAYMLGLVRSRAHPPMRGEKVDWAEIAVSCGLEGKLTTKLKRIGQHGFDAILRCLASKAAPSQAPRP